MGHVNNSGGREDSPKTPEKVLQKPRTCDEIHTEKKKKRVEEKIYIGKKKGGGEVNDRIQHLRATASHFETH